MCIILIKLRDYVMSGYKLDATQKCFYLPLSQGTYLICKGHVIGIKYLVHKDTLLWIKTQGDVAGTNDTCFSVYR